MEEKDQLAEQFDQLEALLQDRGEPTADLDPEMAACLAIAKQLREQAEPPPMPRPLEFRHQVLAAVKPKRKRALYWGPLLAAAAVLAMVFLIPRSPPADLQPTIQVDQQTIKSAMRDNTRQSMLTYLDNAERLLVGMRDYQVQCSDEGLDITPEKRFAKQLLIKQKLLTGDVKRPQFFQARQLFAQLERILVDVNNLDSCSDPTEIKFINNHIQKQRILSKLRLVAQDIRVG